MLERSFLHLTGVGSRVEQMLWAAGVHHWNDLLSEDCPGFARKFRSQIGVDAERLRARDALYFERRLPRSECWRLFSDFVDEAVFLDIETTGLSRDYSVTTLTGLLDRNGFKAFVRGANLDELPDALRQYRLVITFNGARFDIPFLKSEFAWSGQGDLFDHLAHIDLMYPLRRAGFRGGLKAIEKQSGLGRPGELASLDGFDAVRLWRLVEDDVPGALETLVRYNAEDVSSLPRLALLACSALSTNTPLATHRVQESPSFDTSSLPYNPALVRRLKTQDACCTHP
jgi:uncharacterized protein YprB with RNaseH-like and TPR domain